MNENFNPAGFDEAEQAARLRLIMGQMPILLFSTDAQLRITSSFGAPLIHLGLEAGELVGRTLHEVFEKHGPDYVPIRAQQRAVDGESASYEIAWGDRIFQVHVEPLQSSDGGTLGAIAAGLDITQRKQAEEALRKRELEQEFLSQASQILTSSLDYEQTLPKLARLAVPFLADWCIVHFVDPGNKLRRLETAGSTPEQDALLKELATRYPARYDSVDHPIRRALTTGNVVLKEEVTPLDLEKISRNAEHLQLLQRLGFTSLMVAPLVVQERVLGAMAFVHGNSGRRYGRDDLSLAREIADRAARAVDHARLYKEALEGREQLQRHASALRRAQAQIETSNAELRQANEDLVSRTDEAERANSAKSAFLATMSHELRTPLNAISGYAEILELGIRGAVTDAQREDLRRIRHNQQHLLGLINDVLNFAKIEAGQVKYNVVDLKLANLLSGMRELIEPQMKSKNLRYDYRTPSADLIVRADADRTEQILLNLLTNAIKFTSAGGEIVLSTEEDGDKVSIHVSDNGRGIKAERLENIFEPFVQVDPVLTRTNEGTGLGLSISRDLARAMSGELTVDSTPGAGSVFTLSLPIPRRT